MRPIGLSQLFGRSLPYSNLIRGNLDELFGEIGGTNYWDSVMPQKLVIPSCAAKKYFSHARFDGPFLQMYPLVMFKIDSKPKGDALWLFAV